MTDESKLIAFVKKGCDKCEVFKRDYLPKIKAKYKVQLYNLDTIEGLAEASFCGVHTAPVLVKIEGDKPTVVWTSLLSAMRELGV